jgi:hypothetical protein
MLLAVAANPTLAGANAISFGASAPFTFDDLVANARKDDALDHRRIRRRSA